MSTTPGRGTLTGEQILAGRPDTGAGRVTLTGSQILAEGTPLPVRATAGALELLVSGRYIPAGRTTYAGEQILAGAAALPVRVSASAAEVLVSGRAVPPGRATYAGEQILARAPSVPLRVSASVIELLVGNDYSFAPGKFHAASLLATSAASFPDVSQPQSDLYVEALSQSAATPTEYVFEQSWGRVAQSALIASTPSAILDWEPAARLYHQHLIATAGVSDLPAPDAPQSDLYVSQLSAAAAGMTVYPDKAEIQSYARLGHASLSVLSETDPWLPPDAPQSDLDVTQVSQDVAISDTVVTPGSDLYVDHLDARAAANTDYPLPELPQSDLYVESLVESAAAATQYPASYPTDERLHQLTLSALTPAAWIGEYETQLRTHSQTLQATTEAEDGVYVDPILVKPAVEVSYLTNCVAFASEGALGGGPAAEVNAVSEAVACRAYYDDPDAPQSELTVTDVMIEVVYLDSSFGDFSVSPTAGIPVVSIELIYERG